MRLFYILCLFCGLLFTSCHQAKKSETTPWGTPLEQDSMPNNANFSLQDIVSNGELIMFTLSGADTYYDYHGRGMGLHYLLCEKFAQQLGVSLRVEVCKDTAEMIRRLNEGEGDIVAYPLPKSIKNVLFCGTFDATKRTQWAVKTSNTELADTLNKWFNPSMVAKLQKEERFLLSTRGVTRHVYSPMLNRSGGIISKYDNLFQRYAPLARLDWRLMAAQCYQESTFDSNARSWAGASGLMQIMPSTARSLGLPQEDIFSPEPNIAAAAKYLAQLNSMFSDIQNPLDRTSFMLASYNGGAFHIRDAMALAKKEGRDAHRWSEVSPYILKLQQPQYYRDKVVKYGYMRGSETVDYVERIHQRWAQYRGVAHGGAVFSGSMNMPRKAKHKNKYSVN